MEVQQIWWQKQKSQVCVLMLIEQEQSGGNSSQVHPSYEGISVVAIKCGEIVFQRNWIMFETYVYIDRSSTCSNEKN